MSRIRQNFSPNAEAYINKQINMELTASYVYMAMSAYFGRDDVALSGFAHLFAKNSTEEREHAMKLIEYQTKRGGRVVFQDVAKPTRTEWGSAVEAVEAALELEKSVNQSLLELHKIADDAKDPQLMDFVESEYLKEQVDAISEFGHLITRMKRAGEGLGIHLIDKELKD